MFCFKIDIFFVILAPIIDFDKLVDVRSCIARDVLVDYKKLHVKTNTKWRIDDTEVVLLAG